MERCLIKIQRYNPEKDKNPILVEYKVPYVDQGTVLEALIYIYEEIDSTLFFNYGCRYKVCGKCALRINGKPGLACETPISERMVLEPLDNFPIIRDLGVDRSSLIEPLRKYELVLSARDNTEVAIQPPEFFQLIKCNECLSCMSNCPAYSQKGEYGGPFFGIKLAELYYDVRDKRRLLSRLESFLDKCILCKRCDLNCPWDVKFSEIALKLKGEIYKNKPSSVRDWILTHPHLVGSAASIWPSGVNNLVQKKQIRKLMDRFLKVDKRVPIPEYHCPTGNRRFVETQKRDSKVAYILGCYNRFNDLVTAEDSIYVLKAAGLEVEALDLGCCGMPYIGNGNLKAAEKAAIRISTEIKKLLMNDYDIVLSCPSCTSMIKIEYPNLFHQIEEREFQGKIHNLGDYLWKMHEAGKLDVSFKEAIMKIGYHTSCHLKAQKIGLPFIDLLKLIPGVQVQEIFEQCCGMAGTMGYKKEKYILAQKIGDPLIEDIKSSGLDLILSDCPSCRMKIQNEGKVNTLHPISVVRRAIE